MASPLNTFLRAVGLKKPAPAKEAIPSEFLSPPDWFIPNGIDTVLPRKPFFLYQSWIPQHTDKLINSVRDDRYEFVDLNLFDGHNDKAKRVRMLRFAENNPERYKRMVRHKLAPYAGKANGLVVTLDWIPVMRHLVFTAAELGIPTILLPHESVFADQDMYYVHPTLGIRLPASDVILTWGELQRSIFVGRGYPEDRIVKVGAPKFDYINGIRTSKSRSAVGILGLDPAKPVFSFAAQPLDSQYDTKLAREAQTSAIIDLIKSATILDAQVIIRTPPSKDRIFGSEVYSEISSSPHVAIDDASLYLLSPEETIEVSDVLLSVNSTMLLESALADKVAISTKYIEFDQIWDGLNIPVVRNFDEMFNVLGRAISHPEEITSRYDTAWAASAFSVGDFDGEAATRIKRFLSEVAAGTQIIQRGYSKSIHFQPDQTDKGQHGKEVEIANG